MIETKGVIYFLYPGELLCSCMTCIGTHMDLLHSNFIAGIRSVSPITNYSIYSGQFLHTSLSTESTVADIGSVLMLCPCFTVVTIAALALFLTAFVVVQFVQFFAKWDVFGKGFMNKVLLRYWIVSFSLILLIEVALIYLFAEYVPALKLVKILGLPITKWIKIISLLVGLVIFSQVLWASIHFYVGIRATNTLIYNGLIDPEATSEAFGCLLFWLAEVVVINSVPTFKQSKIVGIYTQKWIEACLSVLLVSNIISCFAQTIVWLLLRFDADDSKSKMLRFVLSASGLVTLEKNSSTLRYAGYVASGIKRSIIFVLSAAMLLLTWQLYIGPHLNITSLDKRIMQFGTWTFVSVLICSFLWLIKSCLLLYWEAYTVYDRLHSKFTDIGKQLYFLALLSYTHFQIVIERPTTNSIKIPRYLKLPPEETVLAILISNSEPGVTMILPRKIVREELINSTGPNASAYKLMQAAGYFLNAQYALFKEGNFEGLHHLQSTDSGDNDANMIELLKKIVKCGEYGDADWKILSELLSAVDPTNEITFQKVQIWMERAHSRCKYLANMLQSGKDAAKCLNQIMSGLIIAATVMTWLFLTGLATTAVIAVIASPLLAATFVFGDSAKGLFQGLIFVYVVHPFDVGDLCVIDEKLLAVKRIGVWCTTFSKVRTFSKQQEIIYPNSELATKNVINYKTEFPWADKVELGLSYTEEEATKNLKHQIEMYLDTEKERFTPNFHSVKILEIGDKDKIEVHFRHNVQAKGWIYFECLREKEKRTSEFALYLRNLLNQQELKNKDS
ncbi:mechanosensitive ion channel protein 10-like isoform X1 [Silene latifolia]|uniref:mechanosensitive ion channel protein 10-like isoform X1 n=2 Tax=Silene latifolia TaxID=37657 RepID=UPI003D778616